MEKVLKVFLACALGAFIGSMVALQLNHYFWWLGLLVGGFAGYISYEFKKVMAAAPAAWETAKETVGKAGKTEIHLLGPIKKAGKILAGIFLVLLLGPIKKTGKILVYTFLVLLTGFIVGYCFFVNLNLLAALCSPEVNFLTETHKLISGPANILGTSITGLVTLFLIVLSVGLLMQETMEMNLVKSENKCIVTTVALSVAPILTIFTLTSYAIYKLAPRTAKFIGRFAKQLFLLIHSDIRLLCATDAAIGTAIGYFSGSAVIGAIAGGTFGVINYKIVSEHILRLQPKT